ncbi:chitin elicitor-binding protein-like [Asparagus officinalis]|uniref:chitin elicitor-binding protein-like n=1 Tax=Asparagus officinalis TaxID=4686 RepID=UPI00098E2B41|nr:chitin elicitor-binding protein-like [Asparagus officinalis]
MNYFLLLLFLHLLLLPTSEPARFTCTSPSKSTCHSLIGYTTPNATTLLRIKSLFQIKSLRSLLAATLSLHHRPSTQSEGLTTPGYWVRTACARGPVYKVKAGDGLDSIARNVFNGFVTYQEIASASNITDPNLIVVGQGLVIPLPCSCDDAEGERVLHYGHVAGKGSSLEGIGSEFGVSGEVLMRVNGLKDPKELQAGQVLDVPLRACSSSISSTSIDHDLRVPNGSYILTANNCVQCGCSSDSWQLDCKPTKGINSGSCPAAKCDNMDMGNSTSISVCERSVCSYAGYNKTAIFTNLTTQSLCDNGGAPGPLPSGGSAPRLGMLGLNGMGLLIFLQMALILVCAL